MKILIFTFEGIGDYLMSLPLYYKIKQKFPDAHITFVGRDFGFSPKINGIAVTDRFYNFYDWAYGSNPLGKIIYRLKTLYGLRKTYYDSILVDFYTPCSDVVNYYKKLVHLLRGRNKFILTAEDISHKSAAMQMLSISRHLNIDYELNDRYITIDKDIIANNTAKHLMRKLDPNRRTVALVIGSTVRWIKKNWGYGNFVSLVLKLQPQYNVIILGGRYEEESFSQALVSDIDYNHVLVLVNKTSVAESAEVLRECSLCVGNDTGMLHMAAAVGIATIGLYGGSDPLVYQVNSFRTISITADKRLPCQYCFGTQIMEDCKDNLCMQNISVQKVYDTVVAII